MDIPQAARAAKRAKAEADNPTMARYPEVLEAFVTAQLEEEWGKPGQFEGIGVDMVDGLAVLSFARATGGNAITIPLSIRELAIIHSKAGALLGL